MEFHLYHTQQSPLLHRPRLYLPDTLLRNEIQSSLSAAEISHSVYLYLHIFMWILFLHNSQTGMMNVWPWSLGGRGGTHPSRPSRTDTWSGNFLRLGNILWVEPLHHLNKLWQIKILSDIVGMCIKTPLLHCTIEGVGVLIKQKMTCNTFILAFEV